jgi:hypothetical protein
MSSTVTTMRGRLLKKAELMGGNCVDEVIQKKPTPETNTTPPRCSVRRYAITIWFLFLSRRKLYSNSSFATNNPGGILEQTPISAERSCVGIYEIRNGSFGGYSILHKKTWKKELFKIS